MRFCTPLSVSYSSIFSLCLLPLQCEYGAISPILITSSVVGFFITDFLKCIATSLNSAITTWGFSNLRGGRTFFFVLTCFHFTELILLEISEKFCCAKHAPCFEIIVSFRLFFSIQLSLPQSISFSSFRSLCSRFSAIMVTKNSGSD